MHTVSKILITSIFSVFIINLFVNTIFAQCGADGTQPCGSTKKTTTKKTTSPKSNTKKQTSTKKVEITAIKLRPFNGVWRLRDCDKNKGNNVAGTVNQDGELIVKYASLEIRGYANIKGYLTEQYREWLAKNNKKVPKFDDIEWYWNDDFSEIWLGSFSIKIEGGILISFDENDETKGQCYYQK